MQPRVEQPAPPPPRAELSDIDRRRATRRARAEADATRCRSRAATPRASRSATASRQLTAAARAAPAPAAPPPDAPPMPRCPNRPNGYAAIAGAAAAAARRADAGMLADAIRNVQKYATSEKLRQPAGRRQPGIDPVIQFDSKGVEFGPWLRRFVAQVRRNWFIPQAAMSMQGHVVVTFYVHKDGRITDVHGRSGRRRSTRSTLSALNAILASNPTVPLPPEYPDDKAFFTVTFYFNEIPARHDRPTRTQQIGLLLVLAVLVALALARACVDARSECRGSSPSSARPPPARARSASRSPSGSTARSSAATRPRSIAASTSAPTRCRRPSSGGIPHHLVDVADPTEEYSAARYARDAAAAIRDDHARAAGCRSSSAAPGFYYRALTRGLFPGPGRDTALRARLERVADRRGRRAAAPLAARASIRRRRAASSRAIASGSIRALEVYLADRAAADRRTSPTRRRRCPSTTSLPFALRIPPRDDRGARRAPRGRAVRARPARRDPRAAGGRRARDRAPVHRPGLPAGARASPRRARRGARRAS